MSEANVCVVAATCEAASEVSMSAHDGIQNCTTREAWLFGWRGSSYVLWWKKKVGRVIYWKNCECLLLEINVK